MKGVRAGLAYNTVMARLTREHNNANVLALGGRMQSLADALEMAKVFLETPFSEDRATSAASRCWTPTRTNTAGELA